MFGHVSTHLIVYNKKSYSALYDILLVSDLGNLNKQGLPENEAFLWDWFYHLLYTVKADLTENTARRLSPQPDDF